MAPDLFRKKSRSTVNSPILAYSNASRASSAADATEGSAALRANSDGTPSSAVFFQAWIWLAWTPYRLDKLRHRAILAERRQCHLGLEVNTVFLSYIRHRLPFANHANLGARGSLSYLSSFRGPPQSGVRSRIRFAVPRRVRAQELIVKKLLASIRADIGMRQWLVQ